MCSRVGKDWIRGEEDENSVWEESVPQDVKEVILAGLPAECILRWRIVCKGWNALFSSQNFLTRWSQTLKRDQWLIMGRNDYCLAYSFSTKKWLTTSLFASPFYGYKGSDLGLFLLADCTPRKRTFSVFNPVTQTSFQLPPISPYLQKTYAAYILKGGHGDHYKVVMMSCDGSDAHVVQIYDSFQKSWKIAGQLKVKILAEVVFCNSWFFFTTLEPFGAVRIRVYSFDCSVISYIPIPQNYFSVPKLLVCGKMLLIAIPILKMKVITDIIVWQLECENDFQNPFWKEITRMPKFMLEKLDSEKKWDQSHCIGFEECLCFRIFGGTDVVEYNLIERSWKYLSKCPTAGRDDILSCFSILPNPLLKLGH